MKKTIILVFVIVLATAHLFGQSGTCGDNLFWRLEDGVLTISGKGAMNDYFCNNVPWLSYVEDIQEVIIGNQVTRVGAAAFCSCMNLVSIVMPNSVRSIGREAFWGCWSLTSISLPNSITSIEKRTFWGCKSITSVTIPNSVTYIGDAAFSSCFSLASVTIPNSVTSIGNLAFDHCALRSVTIPSRIINLAENAFEYCNNLRTIRYPEKMDISKLILPVLTKKVAYFDNNQSQIVPPLLTIVDNNLIFYDATQNNRIEVGERCAIRFKILNNGKGSASNCEVRVKIGGSTSGIKVQNFKLPSIAVGQTHEVNIPVSADINTQDGQVTFTIEVYEPNGWGIAPFELTVATKAYEAPLLQVVDYNVASISGKIKKMEPFTLTFNMQNTKYGDAEDVKVKVNLPANVFVMDGSSELSFPLIKSGEAKQVSLTLAANNYYPTTNIPITIDIQEKYGKFAENKQIDIALNQMASSSINIAAKEELKQERKEIQLATLTADVDRNIPQTNIQNKNTFVLIIANEKYQSVDPVPFARNDGNVFRQYCEQTLGIPVKNIRYVSDATGNQLKAQINWLRNVVEVFDNPNIIFYYAGHGIPDESSKTAYLLPVDGIITDISTCYKLDDLYATLGNMPAEHVTVFMDACFSGSIRGNGMLASARSVAIKTKSGVPQGNTVVFAASQGDETAYPYKEKQHGMFTYYLLKILQSTGGDVTLQELGSYIMDNVRRQSLLENDKSQTPTITPSSSVSDAWKTWKLK